IVDHSRAWKCPLESLVGQILLLERLQLFLGGEAPAPHLVQLLLAPGQVELYQRLAELDFGFLGAEADVFRISMGAQHDFQPPAARPGRSRRRSVSPSATRASCAISFVSCSRSAGAATFCT